MSKQNPTKFADLDADELFRSALEDFALAGVDEDSKGNKQALLAAFAEFQIPWSQYVALHPEIAPEAEPEVVTSAAVQGTVEPVETPEEEVVIITAQAPKPNVKEKYLMKMTRDNPRIDFPGRVSFTQEHPYALVDEDMADYLMTKEEGFRQATPSELREFYG